MKRSEPSGKRPAAVVRRPRRFPSALVRILTALLLAGMLSAAQDDETRRKIAGDVVLSAMRQELERARSLKLAAMEDVYFIRFTLDDSANFSVRATLGALAGRNTGRIRLPRVQVRVGSAEFDNTNYVFSDLLAGRPPAAALDDDVLALRQDFWLATDRAYKGALAALARKKAALKNVTVVQELPDFAPAEPVILILDPDPQPVDTEAWTERVRRFSAQFKNYPEIIRSSVRFESIQATTYLATSEGTIARYPENLHFLEFQAEGLSQDGMILRDAGTVVRLDLRAMPGEESMARQVRTAAENVKALVAAPAGESYAGPVLFEGTASAQLLAQLLGENLAVTRRPVAEPGRNVPYQASELEGRIGSRVLPDWMSVRDDPSRREWRGEPLAGHYLIDVEGVVPRPLTLIDKGFLRAFLLTRQPVKDQAGSNGRARLPGQFGASAALFGNLFVEAEETVPGEELKRRLIELCRQRGKPYGVLIRKLDFPSSAGMEDLRRQAVSSRERGATRLFSAPVLAYRVYPDGREELVRGLNFRAMTVRILRDIVAASRESTVFHYVGNNAPLSLMGAGGYVTALSVVAPSLLVEEVELDREAEERPTLPLVPPPPLAE